MRRLLGPGLCFTVLLAFTACGGDDSASSDSTTGATTDSDGSGVDGSGVDETGVDGSQVTTDGSDSTGGDAGTTTVAGSTKTTAAGSSSSTAAGSTGTTIVDAPGTTVPGSGGTTIAGTGTTSAPGPTSAVPREPADLTLLADGLGPLRFGADSDVVVNAVNAVLGQPISDAPAEYPFAVEGAFHSEDEELEFIWQFGRSVCWSNGLCTEFGGPTPGPYAFVGWYYYGATDTDQLAAPSGLDVGSTWDEFDDVMTVDTGGCFTVGFGSADGVELSLQSSGDPFVTVDEDGNETPTTPDPADVTVVQMQAGEQVEFLLGDC